MPKRSRKNTPSDLFPIDPALLCAVLPPSVLAKLDRGEHIKWAGSLGGGTLLGAIQPPIFEALEDLLGPPAIMAGVSIGANNAVMIANGRHEELRALWATVNGPKTFMRVQADFWNGLHSVKKLRELHEEWNTCKDLQCPVYVGTVDAATRHYQSVLLNELTHISDRRDAVVASSLQAFIMERWQFRGRYCLDGGFKHNTPLLPGWDGMDLIITSFCSPVGESRMVEVPQSEVSEAWEQGMIGLEMLLDVVVARDFARVCEAGKTVPSLVLAPATWEQIGKSFDGKPDTIRRRWNEVAPAIVSAPVFVSA